MSAPKRAPHVSPLPASPPTIAMEARNAPSSSMPSALKAPKSAIGPQPKYSSSRARASSYARRGTSLEDKAEALPVELEIIVLSPFERRA